MQLPRVVIAAVFFVIGALIAVPAAIDTFSSSNASEKPQSKRPAVSLTTSATVTGSPSATKPSGTKPPTKAPALPVTPKPTTPAQPLKVIIGRVDCSGVGRKVVVSVENQGTIPQDYTVETDDGLAPKGDRIPGKTTQTVTVNLREDRRTWITVKWRNEQVKRERRTANCTRAATSPSPDQSPGKSPDRLPHTGSDTAVIWARTATGVGAMITGLIIFWYGGIWPRRRDPIFSKKDSD